MQGSAININFLVLTWNYYVLVLIFSQIHLENSITAELMLLSQIIIFLLNL
jgi:hypothetical protein